MNETTDTLRRKVHKLELKYVFLLLLLFTVLLFVLDVWFSTIPQNDSSIVLRWLHKIPWNALATSAFSATLIGYFYELYMRDSSNDVLLNDLRQVHAEALEDSIDQYRASLLLDTNAIRDLLSDKVADELLMVVLEKKTGDSSFAKDCFDSLSSQISEYERSCREYTCNITLRKTFDKGYFECFVSLSYRGTLLLPELEFIEIGSTEEYNTLAGDNRWEARVIRPPTLSYPKNDRRAFNVRDVSVDGEALDVVATETDGKLTYIATHDGIRAKCGNDVLISYTYSTMLESTAHVYEYVVPFPTRGMRVNFNYDSVDIGRVNVFDFFCTIKKPAVRYPNMNDAVKTIEVSLDDWVLPKSGVLFGWVLKSEMDPQYVKTLNGG